LSRAPILVRRLVRWHDECRTQAGLGLVFRGKGGLCRVHGLLLLGSKRHAREDLVYKGWGRRRLEQEAAGGSCARRGGAGDVEGE
jgi:hypothetical protein